MFPQVSIPALGLTLSTYILLNVVSWFVFFLVGRSLTKDEVRVNRHWVVLGMAMAFSYLIGANLLARLKAGGIGALRWDSIINEPAGFWGGPFLFAAIAMVYLFSMRIAPYPFWDAFAIAWSSSQVIAKLACFAAGCCFGTATGLPWGISFYATFGNPTPYHPTQIYEAAAHLVLTVALYASFRRRMLRGKLLFALGCFYGVVMPLIELTEGRDTLRVLGGPFSVTQTICITALVFCLAFFVFDAKHSARVQSKSKST